MQDSDGETAASTLTLNVMANITAAAVADADSFPQGNASVAGTVNVLANDDGNPALSVTAASQVGTTLPITIGTAFNTLGGNVLTLNADGSFSFTPLQVGVETFTYTITDADGDTATADLVVTVEAQTGGTAVMYFSTVGNGAVPDAVGPYDDADVYAVDALTGGVFSRVVNATNGPATPANIGLPNNADIDGLSVIDENHFYVSFAAATTTVGGVQYQDEDVVEYNNGTWSLFFNGSTCGLDASNGGDIDAISVVGSTLYFSTAGNVAVDVPIGTPNSGTQGGGNAQWDDADVYSWSVGAGICGRALDVMGSGVRNILPGNADIDGLTVVGSTYYMSFNRNGGTNVSYNGGPGVVQDEAVVKLDTSSSRVNWTWTVEFDGTGLNTDNAQDVDAIHIP
jgi:hypothetical protein